jgi:anti-sigma factor (TIGR02949 family)
LALPGEVDAGEPRTQFLVGVLGLAGDQVIHVEDAMARSPHEQRGGGDRVTCREAIDILADYLDLTLTAETIARFEAHLEACGPCRAYLATYRATRTLVADAAQVEMPAEMKRRLRAFLREVLEGEAS